MTTCPKCGKSAKQIRRYRDGSGYAVHSEKCGLMGFAELSGCMLTKADMQKLAAKVAQA